MPPVISKATKKRVLGPINHQITGRPEESDLWPDLMSENCSLFDLMAERCVNLRGAANDAFFVILDWMAHTYMCALCPTFGELESRQASRDTNISQRWEIEKKLESIIF